MNASKTYVKLSFRDKELLLKRITEGESVSELSRQAKISRTIIYKWLSISKKDKPRKHWRKLSRNKELSIISLWKNNPNHSIRLIANKTNVSVGAVWNTVKNYKASVEKSGKKIKRYSKKSYRVFLPEQKIELMNRFYEGEAIAKICREQGISRTIFYKWLSASSEHNSWALEKHNPRGVSHWRFRPEVRSLALEIVIQKPELSLSQIAIAIKNEGRSISKSGLYYILKQMNLSTYEARVAYISSNKMQEISWEKSAGSEYSIPINAACLLPQFVVFTVFWLIAAVVLLSSLTQKPIVNYPLTISNTPAINESKNEEYSKKGERAKQDFRWGALSMNSSKDRYKTRENIELGFGVVDHLGNTVCNAEISLEIINPEGRAVFKGRELEDKVRPSGECSLRSVTNTADYVFIIPGLDKQGEYSLNIKAKTYEGEREFKQKFLVANSFIFEIERASYPTRIFPSARYPVEVVIKANKDFKGTISESLPKEIIASDISDRGVLLKKEEANERIIKWKVDLKKGDVYSLRYNLYFPQIWPEFYEIGPLKFTDSKTGKLVWQEARYWQVVADAAE